MKTLLLVLCLVAPARADWHSKLNLAAPPKAAVAREIHDGNWLAGAAWVPYKFQHNLDFDVHAGLLQAWRTNHGDPATCLLIGVGTGPVGQYIKAANAALNLPSVFKFLEYGGAAVSLDGFTGYRPHPAPDVHAFVYGLAAQLTIAFGEAELQKGL